MNSRAVATAALRDARADGEAQAAPVFACEAQRREWFSWFASSGLGTQSVKLPLHAPSPDPHHLDQAVLPGIIPGTGIPPMLRLVDIAAFDRVLVDLVQFVVYRRIRKVWA